jgi:hypothetical protein
MCTFATIILILILLKSKLFRLVVDYQIIGYRKDCQITAPELTSEVY